MTTKQAAPRQPKQAQKAIYSLINEGIIVDEVGLADAILLLIGEHNRQHDKRITDAIGKLEEVIDQIRLDIG